MRSVRLDHELDARLEETARVTGEPVSKIIREAVRRRCDEVLGGRLDRRLADVVGMVSVGGSSRKTGRKFTDLLALKKGAKRTARRAVLTRGAKGRRR